jgi:redox-sensitive bicupin YhaK (pirin superfamily)
VLSGEARDGAIEIRADADVYFGQLDAGKELVHRPSTGRAQWLHVIAGEVSVSGESLTSGDGAAFENFETLNIHSHAAAQFLLFDLK